MSTKRPVHAARIPGAGILSVIYSIFRRICLVVGDDYAIPVCQVFINLFYTPLRKKRFRNYHLFFGTKDDRDHAALDRDHLRFLALQTAEIVRAIPARATLIKRHKFAGREHLDAALAQKRGVLLISPHLGNFYIYHGALTHHGYEVTNVSEAIPIPSMERQVDRMRKAYNINTVFLEQGAARSAMKTLKSGGILSIVFDVSLRQKQAVLLPFGHTALPLDIGPALMAVRCGAIVLPVKVESHSPYAPEVEILPPFPEPVGANEHEKALNMLAHWRDWLEDELKRRPAQWWAWSFQDFKPLDPKP